MAGIKGKSGRIKGIEKPAGSGRQLGSGEKIKVMFSIKIENNKKLEEYCEKKEKNGEKISKTGVIDRLIEEYLKKLK